ncbi:MAG: ribonuclease H-like domain-containing protein [Thermaerobacterales bacterium]
MSLGERLARLREQGLLPAAGGAAPAAREAAVSAGEAEPASLAETLSGRLETTPLGPAVLIETHFSLEHGHGDAALAEATDLHPEHLAWLAAAPAGPDHSQRTSYSDLRLQDLTFWDTETSGLAGGTGSYVILVGAGRFIQSRFTVKQFVLPDLAANVEAPFLYAAMEALHQTPAWCTFNGRAFDASLLTTRLIMNRFPDGRNEAKPTAGCHFDLLHPARRLYRWELPQCTLALLEERLLGFTRQDDLPGAKVPVCFQQFLQDRRGSGLLPILRHNLLDILSLARLAAHLSRRAAAVNPARGQYGSTIAHLTPGELYGLARTHIRHGNDTAALRLFQRLHCHPHLQRSSNQQLAHQVDLEFSLLLKRCGHWLHAEELLRSLISTEPPNYRSFIALAKIIEHNRRHCREALEVVQQALSLARRREQLGQPAPHSEMADLRHRAQRLLRKSAGSAYHIDSA